MKVPSNCKAGEYVVCEEWAESGETTKLITKGTYEACIGYMRRARWPARKSGKVLGLLVVVDKDLKGQKLQELGFRISSWVL